MYSVYSLDGALLFSTSSPTLLLRLLKGLCIVNGLDSSELDYAFLNGLNRTEVLDVLNVEVVHEKVL